MSAAELRPQPHSEIEAIPARVAGLRACFESGRSRPLEWLREQL